jgi:chemotaxis protein MotB
MSKAPVIIVRRKRKTHHGRHGGAWKVAYADFVTAMMAFFLVLWIVGQSDAVKAGVAGYFRDPGVLDQAGAAGLLDGATTGIDPIAPPEAPGPSAAPMDRASLEESARRIRDILKNMPELGDLEAQIEIKATSEGLRIELVDSTAATFFDSASAVLKPATERILAVIARELASLDRPIVVEGHTDSRPYNRGTGYGNWELSADRANAARRQLELSGLPARQLRAVRGFADRQLAEPSDRLSPRNRRVSILVVAPVSHTAGPLPGLAP